MLCVSHTSITFYIFPGSKILNCIERISKKEKKKRKCSVFNPEIRSVWSFGSPSPEKQGSCFQNFAWNFKIIQCVLFQEIFKSMKKDKIGFI